MGNIDSDPLFVDPAARDFHNRHDSPCRNMGSNQVAPPQTFDFEGDPRVADGKVDIGADEFYPHLYYTGETKPGSTATVKVIGDPIKTTYWAYSFVPAFLNPPMPLPGLRGALEHKWPFALIPPGPISNKGFVSLNIPLHPNLPTPMTIPTQALIGLQLTNADVVEVR